MNQLEQKICKAIDDNRLKLIEGKKYWYGYSLLIQELVWARNNHDGYLIDVYNKKDNAHLLRMTI